MSRSHVVLLAAGTAALSLIPAAAIGKSTRKVAFTNTASGASLSATRSALADHDSVFGNGAGVQTTKTAPSGTSGTDTTIVYYGNATLTSHDSFSIGQPDANGIAAVTGKGHDFKGTGKAKGVTSTYTFTGTFNTKTTVYTVKLKGTYTLPR